MHIIMHAVCVGSRRDMILKGGDCHDCSALWRAASVMQEEDGGDVN